MLSLPPNLEKSATTPVARRCNLVMEYLVTYLLWPFAFTWPIAFLALIIAAHVATVFVATLKAFCACCCDENPSAALYPALPFPLKQDLRPARLPGCDNPAGLLPCVSSNFK